VHLRHLTPADARRVPWKNGRGVTDELAVWPPGAAFESGDYAWRLARAGVEQDGPFSSFPGFDRLLVVIEGAGLRLRHGAAPSRLVPPLQPVRFAGEESTMAELVDGPVRDLNLLLRRGAVRGELAVLALAAEPQDVPLEGEHIALVPFRGTTQVRGLGAPVALAAGEWLWLRDAAAHVTLVAEDAALALVRIERA